MYFLFLIYPIIEILLKVLYNDNGDNMEKHLKTLNIAILALFAANTLFFSIKNTIFEVVFFKLPISATDIFIIIDYIVFIFLIINVLLIIVVQIKNKKEVNHLLIENTMTMKKEKSISLKAINIFIFL